MPKPRPGEILLKVRYLSLDPYMHGRMEDRESYAEPAPLGAMMPGESVATVLESHHPDYVPGDTVHAFTGWRTHALVRRHEGEEARSGCGAGFDAPWLPGDARLLSIRRTQSHRQTGHGRDGRCGSGERLAGGQLARIAGARAVGIAGGLRKCDFIRQELGFDEAIEHRASDFPSLLAVACPDGIDVYFESVGGAVWQTILPLLNQFARAPVCGLIAQLQQRATTGGRRPSSRPYADHPLPKPHIARFHQLRVRKGSLSRLSQ